MATTFSSGRPMPSGREWARHRFELTEWARLVTAKGVEDIVFVNKLREGILDGSDETNFFETAPTEKNINSGVGKREHD
uniref:Uncharacterized protein n=1 Tax=Oryza sativa subsp. japonica TaxID=39947 RepID=Q6ZL99_ORYSJ|nr:hypothetical protein [Oryza sativa Japonica Group]